jgi:hypothetical protein
MNNCYICWIFTFILNKCTVKEAEFRVKYLDRQRWVVGFNFGVKRLMHSLFTPTCFGKCLPTSADRTYLRNYPSSVCIVGVWRPLWPVVVECTESNIPRHLATLDETQSVYAHNTNITWVASKALTATWKWQPFAEYVGVNWEYIKNIYWLVDTFCWSFATVIQKCRVQLSRRQKIM